MKIALNLRKLFICMTCLLCLAVSFLFVGCGNNTDDADKKDTPKQETSITLQKSDCVLALNTTIQKINNATSTTAVTNSVSTGTTDYIAVTEEDFSTLRTLNGILTFAKNIYSNENVELTTKAIAFNVTIQGEMAEEKANLLWKIQATYSDGAIKILLAIADKDNPTRDKVEIYEVEINYTIATKTVGNFKLTHFGETVQNFSEFKGVGSSVYMLDTTSNAYETDGTYYTNNALRIFNELQTTTQTYDFTTEYNNVMSSQIRTE